MDENIKIILIKYITGDADEKERTRVREWIGESQDNLDHYISLKSAWQDALHHPGEKTVDADKAFTRLSSRLRLGEEEQLPAPGLPGSSEFTEGPFPEIPPAMQPVIPPAALREFRGRRWRRLPAAAVITGLALGAAAIGFGLYRGRQHPPLQQAFEVFVPNGKMKRIQLPDSTEVWLNAGTRFSYGAGYGETNREVSLEGEGYFSVRHNERVPFTVKAHGYTIRDIGTIFTISAYPDNKNFETAVIEGKVEVTGSLSKTGGDSGSDGSHRILLSKNEVLKIPQQALISDRANSRPGSTETGAGKDTGTSAHQTGKSPVNDRNSKTGLQAQVSTESEMDSYAGWKDRLLVFNEETFDGVAGRLERTFDVKIRISDDQLARYRYTGRFNKVQNITEALNIIQKTTPITYRLEKGIIVIMPGKKGL